MACTAAEKCPPLCRCWCVGSDLALPLLLVPDDPPKVCNTKQLWVWSQFCSILSYKTVMLKLKVCHRQKSALRESHWIPDLVLAHQPWTTTDQDGFARGSWSMWTKYFHWKNNLKFWLIRSFVSSYQAELITCVTKHWGWGKGTLLPTATLEVGDMIPSHPMNKCLRTLSRNPAR